MQFALPLALWLLPLAALPFFLRRPDPAARARAVSALHLWTAAPPHSAARPVRRAWRDPLALVQSLCLLALIVAAAQPNYQVRAADLVFVVDVSASMGARGPSGDRL